MGYGYRYSASSNWGELFGLVPKDLNEEQLKKIEFVKLIEFANQDPRVEKIIGDKLMKCGVEDIKTFDKLKNEELASLPYAMLQYNKCIRQRSAVLEEDEKKNYSISRSSYILWPILDKSNRAKEFARWIDGKPSIIETNKINYPWLYDNYGWLANQIVEKVLKNSNYDINAAIRLVKNIPEKPTEKYIARIFECHRDIFAHALSNEFTPRNYIVKALREIAGKKRVPGVRVMLDKSMLLELPPVMRLKILESLLIYMRNGKLSFSDITNEEELKPLLFGTAIKYNARVQTVVKRFKYLCT
ncbi:hypothetical protein LCGC14_1454970 [marine sediment metagenome]|uniref:Uncharacterized protein n=1 Tax=marine sediment metagenome TaxID=412755 RepID=A0A0F9JGP6_9ZZZZ